MVEGRDSGPARQLNKHSADEQDARPFEERVIACRPRLLRVAYVMLGNREDAEDVTQRAMFKAIQSQHLFRGDSGLYTWLYRILVNQSKDRRKARSRAQRHFTEMSDALSATVASSARIVW